MSAPAQASGDSNHPNQEDIESAARAAFEAEYPAEFLAHLDQTKDKRDLVELLWCAFAHGYLSGNAGQRTGPR